jgi:MerR family transcriptional regulator, light-induced transcriptional regulator
MPESSPHLPGRSPQDLPAEGIATPEFVASLLADGDDDLAAWAIEQALEEQPRTAVFDGLVRSSMELVGHRWETGQWTISQEHLASVALMGALARLRPGDPAEARIGPVAVLAAPAGEQHVAGLACLAQILEERGWRVENLGANVPEDDLRDFVRARSVDLVALSIGTAERVPALLRAIDALRSSSAAGRHTPIMVGGHGIAGSESEIGGADLVSADLAHAERFVGTLEAAWDTRAGA